MLYTMKEAAELLSTSKVTIYNKIKNHTELSDYVKVRNKVKYIDSQGLDMLKSLLINNNTVKDIKNNDVKNTFNLSIDNDLSCLQNDFIISLKEQIDYLKSQLETKDEQLKSKDDLLRNFQVLLRDERDNNIKLLEDIESKKVKSFWNRIFKFK